MTGMTTYMVGGLGGVNIVISPLTSINPIYANVLYYQQFTAQGGTGPYTWANTTVLPQGLTLYSNGNLIGNTRTATSYSFTVQATDSATPTHHVGTRPYSGTITYYSYSVTYTIIGGGAQGGFGPIAASVGGGGGAGGIVCGSFSFCYSGNSANTYKIIIGAGGGVFSNNPGYKSYVTYCTPTLSGFGNVVACGGGYGGGYVSSPGYASCGGAGGSGGGGAAYITNPGTPTGKAFSYGGAGTGPQGNSGGQGYYTTPTGAIEGGGGGGASTGGNAGSCVATVGYGGTGKQFVQYSPYGAYVNPSLYPTTSTAPGYGWFGGGGGGGAPSSTRQGGLGGGGQGGTGSAAATPGATNTGGGGGGGGSAGPAGSGGYPITGGGAGGGSGIVFLTVPTQYYPGNAPGASVVKVCGPNTILAYTGTGTYKT